MYRSHERVDYSLGQPELVNWAAAFQSGAKSALDIQKARQDIQEGELDLARKKAEAPVHAARAALEIQKIDQDSAELSVVKAVNTADVLLKREQLKVDAETIQNESQIASARNRLAFEQHKAAGKLDAIGKAIATGTRDDLVAAANAIDELPASIAAEPEVVELIGRLDERGASIGWEVEGSPDQRMTFTEARRSGAVKASQNKSRVLTPAETMEFMADKAFVQDMVSSGASLPEARVALENRKMISSHRMGMAKMKGEWDARWREKFKDVDPAEYHEANAVVAGWHASTTHDIDEYIEEQEKAGTLKKEHVPVVRAALEAEQNIAKAGLLSHITSVLALRVQQDVNASKDPLNDFFVQKVLTEEGRKQNPVAQLQAAAAYYEASRNQLMAALPSIGSPNARAEQMKKISKMDGAIRFMRTHSNGIMANWKRGRPIEAVIRGMPSTVGAAWQLATETNPDAQEGQEMAMKHAREILKDPHMRWLSRNEYDLADHVKNWELIQGDIRGITPVISAQAALDAFGQQLIQLQPPSPDSIPAAGTRKDRLGLGVGGK